MRSILSNLSVINIALAAALIIFGSYAFLPLIGKSVKLTLPAAKKQTASTAAAPEKPADSKTPSPSDYFIIAEQNIFHPERKIPVEKKEAAPLPKPEFVLYGTLILDDVRIAYMEDKKAPQNAPTRGKKQIPLKMGEALSGFTLKEIDADKVVMVRGDEKIAVNLNDPAKSKAREAAATATAAPGTQAAAPGQQPQPVAQPPQRQRTPPQQASQPQAPAAAAATAQGQNPQPSAQQPQVGRGLFRRARNLD